MQVVQQRDAATLLSIIEEHVAPGTIVHSDEWKAYSRVSVLPHLSSHEIVNHSMNFVDPASSVHTQNIESYCNNVKQKLKRMEGCHADQLPDYLDEHMWRERYGSTRRQVLESILSDIAQQYPIPSYIWSTS